MTLDEVDPLPDREVADVTLADFGEEGRKRKRLAEMLLNLRAEHDDIERLEHQVREEARVDINRSVEVPVAHHAVQKRQHVCQDLLARIRHEECSSTPFSTSSSNPAHGMA